MVGSGLSWCETASCTKLSTTSTAKVTTMPFWAKRFTAGTTSILFRSSQKYCRVRSDALVMPITPRNVLIPDTFRPKPEYNRLKIRQAAGKFYAHCLPVSVSKVILLLYGRLTVTIDQKSELPRQTPSTCPLLYQRYYLCRKRYTQTVRAFRRLLGRVVC